MNLELVTKTEGVGKYKGLSSEEIVAAIARHGVIKEDNGKLVKYLMTNKHWSPLDMINFGFEVETSRAIARQWLRHASLKPQEHSQRYSDRVEFENFEIRLEHPTNRQSSTEVIGTIIHPYDFYVNGGQEEYEKWGKLLNRVGDLFETIETLYGDLIKAGVAKESARFILPEATRTTLTFSGSLRSWLSFLNVRCDHHAQKEIVILATLVGEALEKEMPGVFSTIDWRNGMFM